MGVTDEPLLPRTRALREGTLTPKGYVAELRERFETTNGDIAAFLPETDRWQRLESDIEALERRYPEPALRPPLYGVAVGIKDIFAIEALPRTAGSALPADALADAKLRRWNNSRLQARWFSGGQSQRSLPTPLPAQRGIHTTRLTPRWLE